LKSIEINRKSKQGKRKSMSLIVLMIGLFLSMSLMVGCDDQPLEPGGKDDQQQGSNDGKDVNNGSSDNNDGNGQVPDGTNGDIGKELDDIVFKDGYYRPSVEQLPAEIKAWIEYSKEIEVVQEQQFEGNRYILITSGTKPTGGYGVEIQEVAADQGELGVKVKFTEPNPDHMVTQVITYPYDIVIVENNELPLSFIDVDNPDKYFMGLLFMDAIDRPIVASGGWINLFTPEPNSQIQDTIKLTGIANVFEGTVNYEVVSEAGEVLLSGYTTASMGDWAYFEEDIKLPSDIGNHKNISLEVYSESAKDGSKMYVIQIPLKR